MNDEWKNFEPRRNAPRQEADKSPSAPVDINDNDAIRAMCKEELVLAIHANSGKAVVAQLVNALLDRIDGKAAQTIKQDVDIDSKLVIEVVRFAGTPYDNGIKTIENEKDR